MNLPAERLPSAQSPEFLDRVVDAARDKSVDMDKFERLVRMRNDELERANKRAFGAALSQMQEHLPVITERGVIDIGRGKPQTYALWEDINETIKPILARFGFALSFRTGRDGDKIIVTGILWHADGHSEETTMPFPIDASGSKNAVQAIGSSISYGKRYTAGALLNLTSRGEDDDGKAGGNEPVITADQLKTLTTKCNEKGRDPKLLAAKFRVKFLDDLPARSYDDALALVDSVKTEP